MIIYSISLCFTQKTCFSSVYKFNEGIYCARLASDFSLDVGNVGTTSTIAILIQKKELFLD